MATCLWPLSQILTRRCGSRVRNVDPYLILMILELAFIGLLQITSYRSVESQTDSSPFYTSIGEKVHKYGVAVSRDLLCPLVKDKNKLHKRDKCAHKNRLHYGDWIYVEGFGLRVVNDTMHPRHRRHIDLWVATHAEEKAIQVRKGEVWLVPTEIKNAPIKTRAL